MDDWTPPPKSWAIVVAIAAAATTPIMVGIIHGRPWSAIASVATIGTWMASMAVKHWRDNR